MRDKGRHIDEIAGAGLGHEFEPVAPAHAGPSADHVDHALHRPVMVRAGLGFRMDDDGSRPSFSAPARAWVMAAARFMPGVCGRVDVELARTDHPDAVETPRASLDLSMLFSQTLGRAGRSAQ